MLHGLSEPDPGVEEDGLGGDAGGHRYLQALCQEGPDLGHHVALRRWFEDVSVVGFDDVELARYAGLTTVAQPLELSGARAAELLLAAQHLWRGPALSDVRAGPLLQPQIKRLEESRLTTVEQGIEALGFDCVDDALHAAADGHWPALVVADESALNPDKPEIVALLRRSSLLLITSGVGASPKLPPGAVTLRRPVRVGEITARVPPFEILIDWNAVVQMYILFGILFTLSFAVLVRLLQRLKIFLAIKMGESQ